VAHVVEQLQGRGVGPVHVVEDEQRRVAPGDRPQPRLDRLEQADRLVLDRPGRRRGQGDQAGADAGPDVGEQPADLARPALEVGAQPLARAPVGVDAERLADRLARAADAGVPPAVEHGRALGVHPQRQVGGDRRAAVAALAPQQDHAGVAVPRGPPRAEQHVAVVVEALDEPVRRPARPLEVGGGQVVVVAGVLAVEPGPEAQLVHPLGRDPPAEPQAAAVDQLDAAGQLAPGHDRRRGHGHHLVLGDVGEQGGRPGPCRGLAGAAAVGARHEHHAGGAGGPGDAEGRVGGVAGAVEHGGHEPAARRVAAGLELGPELDLAAGRERDLAHLVDRRTAGGLVDVGDQTGDQIGPVWASVCLSFAVMSGIAAIGKLHESPSPDRPSRRALTVATGSSVARSLQGRPYNF
jgi:hypothetical protein